MLRVFFFHALIHWESTKSSSRPLENICLVISLYMYGSPCTEWILGVLPMLWYDYENTYFFLNIYSCTSWNKKNLTDQNGHRVNWCRPWYTIYLDFWELYTLREGLFLLLSRWILSKIYPKQGTKLWLFFSTLLEAMEWPIRKAVATIKLILIHYLLCPCWEHHVFSIGLTSIYHVKINVIISTPQRSLIVLESKSLITVSVICMQACEWCPDTAP